MARKKITTLQEFLEGKDMESLKFCNTCKKDVPLSQFNIRKRAINGRIYFGFRSVCTPCTNEYFSDKRSARGTPVWAISDELYDTYIYGEYLIKCIKNPNKKCPKCNEIKNKIYDFGARRRGQYYTYLEYCKPCMAVVKEKERQRNIARVRKAERARHHIDSKALSARYIKKQIGRKKRCERYKKEPLLIPTHAEQRLSCAKWRIDTLVKKLSQ